MTRSRLIGLAGAATAGALFASVLVVSLMFFDGAGLAHTTAASTAGWLMPVAAGLTAAGVAWGLGRSRPTTRDDTTEQHTVAACVACGGSVFDEWRLCPHCGTIRDGRGRRNRSA